MGALRRLRPEPFSQNGSRGLGAVKTAGDRGGPRRRRVIEALSFLAVFALSYAAVKYGAEWAAGVLA